MDLGEDAYPTMSPSGRLAFTDPDPYIFHFPDGNAGVARALVRALIPRALPGSTMADLVTAAVDYAKLDEAGKRGPPPPQLAGRQGEACRARGHAPARSRSPMSRTAS